MPGSRGEWTRTPARRRATMRMASRGSRDGRRGRRRGTRQRCPGGPEGSPTREASPAVPGRGAEAGARPANIRGQGRANRRAPRTSRAIVHPGRAGTWRRRGPTPTSGAGPAGRGAGRARRALASATTPDHQQSPAQQRERAGAADGSISGAGDPANAAPAIPSRISAATAIFLMCSSPTSRRSGRGTLITLGRRFVDRESTQVPGGPSRRRKAPGRSPGGRPRP